MKRVSIALLLLISATTVLADSGSEGTGDQTVTTTGFHQVLSFFEWFGTVFGLR